jgi:uncharacterized protein (TIGR03118 family)
VGGKIAGLPTHETAGLPAKADCYSAAGKKITGKHPFDIPLENYLLDQGENAMDNAMRFSGKICTLACLVFFLALSWLPFPALAGGYVQTNLVSDGFVPAQYTDPNLVNPWGISFSATSPFWVSDNGTGVITLYNGAGSPQALVVTIPRPGGTGTATPTGQVFNAFSAISGFNQNLFIFATEDGTIAGWRGALGATAELLVDNSGLGAVYKGLALGDNAGNLYLYAANFHNGTIDVFPGTGAPALPGNFTDPNLPSGYAPFNVQNLGGNLYVTYALQNGTQHDDVPGPGNGYVNIFDLNGNLLRRLISQGALNSPWGLALAPAQFGTFSNALLVANFGDGRINAFDPSSGTLLGTLKDGKGNPLVIDGLWGLIFGNGGNGGDTNRLYFTAGPGGKQHGLFGSLASASALAPSLFLLLD